jgi:hypothetical protein
MTVKNHHIAFDGNDTRMATHADITRSAGVGIGQEQGAGFASHPRPAKRSLPPAAGKGLRAPTTHTVHLRTAAVAQAMVRGMGRSAILQMVAEQQKKEMIECDNGGSALSRAPHVWGDKPIPERTIDMYIRRAKDALAEEGVRLTRQREYVLAMQLARYNEIYRFAMAAERFSSCVRVLERIDRLFGLEETIKVMILQELPTRASADEQEGRDDLSNEEGRSAALSRLIQKAITRDPHLVSTFARFAQPGGSRVTV